MMDSLIAAAMWLNEHGTWVLVFATLLVCAVELWNCSRKPDPRQPKARWLNAWRVNIALLLTTFALTWALEPWLSPLFSGALAAESGLLSKAGLGVSGSWPHVVAGFILLDLVTYGLHRLMHAVPLLWRIHQVHHSDPDMNASTHFRQHPAYFIPSTLVVVPALWLLGISGLSWVLYVTVNGLVQLWQHAALPINPRAERYLGWLLVTPQFHRTHHDERRIYNDSNYGALLSVWDRIFGSHSAVPQTMRLGINSLPYGEQPSLLQLFTLPFVAPPPPPASNISQPAPPPIASKDRATGTARRPNPSKNKFSKARAKP